MPILKVSKKPKENSVVFFGETSRVINIIDVSHPFARKMKKNSEGNSWFVDEVDYKGDGTRFNTLNEDTKRLFKLNIAYQTLMDSGVTNGLIESVIRCISNSEFNSLYTRIAMEENIHAESYSYGLSEVFGNAAQETIDLIYTDEMVQKRMNNESKLFDNLINILDNRETDDHLKKSALLKLLFGIYLLEGIKFPFSFFITFNINHKNNDCIPGFNRTIRLIANDELNTHVPTGNHVIRLLKSDPEQGFNEVYKECEKYAIKTVYEVVKQEEEWAEYLLKDRDIVGFTLQSAIHFINYQAYHKMKGLGIELTKIPEKYRVSTPDIEWYDNYRNLNNLNVASQESTNTVYNKGLSNDIPPGKMKNMDYARGNRIGLSDNCKDYISNNKK